MMTVIKVEPQQQACRTWGHARKVVIKMLQIQCSKKNFLTFRGVKPVNSPCKVYALRRCLIIATATSLWKCGMTTRTEVSFAFCSSSRLYKVDIMLSERPCGYDRLTVFVTFSDLHSVLLFSRKVLVLEDPRGLICKSLSLSLTSITNSFSLSLIVLGLQTPRKFLKTDAFLKQSLWENFQRQSCIRERTIPPI